MRLIIEKDYDALSKWAAEYVIKRINEFNPTPEHRFVLGLPNRFFSNWNVQRTCKSVQRRTCFFQKRSDIQYG